MYGEIITIGNELITGRTLDLNSWYASGRLTASGLRVTRITTVGDDLERASRAIKDSVTDSQFVIITGGLGSTEDDITNEIVAKVLGRPLRLHQEMFQLIKSYVDRRGIELSPSLEKMAWMPEGSKILDPKGTACGFSLIENRVHLYFLPGVPDQMRYLMDKIVLPELLSRYQTLPVLRQRILKLYGLSEPAIADLLKDLKTKGEESILGFYPYFPENHITISVRGQDEASVTRELDRVEKDIRNLVGPFIFASGHERMEGVVGKMLKEKSLSISLAESCTGGLIGNLLTNIPGSSNYFQGEVVVYSNLSKEKMLKVSSETLEKYGAVSEQTVREMAEGARKLFETDMALAVTGIAGPDGGSRKKPVGTVCIGLAVGNKSLSNRYRFWGTREQIKLNSAMMALDCTRRHLNGDSFLPGV
ncbi:MAG: competence/damage-inducible protein A [Pseudomonadota bacterium]